MIKFKIKYFKSKIREEIWGLFFNASARGRNPSPVRLSHPLRKNKINDNKNSKLIT